MALESWAVGAWEEEGVGVVAGGGGGGLQSEGPRRAGLPPGCPSVGCAWASMAEEFHLVGNPAGTEFAVALVDVDAMLRGVSLWWWQWWAAESSLAAAE